MAKTKQFGRVRQTGGSGDGEERVVQSLRQQHVRENSQALENDGCEIAEDEVDADFENGVEENGIGIEEEEVVGDLQNQFEDDVARDEVDENDGDSGDDIWNDDTIPDPLSSDDDEEECQHKIISLNSDNYKISDQGLKVSTFRSGV